MVLTLFKLRMRQLLAGLLTSKKLGKTPGKGGKIALGALFVFLVIYWKLHWFFAYPKHRRL